MKQNEGTANLPRVTVYTDGACSPNPGPGGWGAVILEGERVLRELSGFGGTSTNNRMELTAAVEALQSLETPHAVELFTDSQYLRNGITGWIDKWQRNNWLTADKKPVKNSDLWRELLELIEHHRVVWKWVKGHGVDRWNNRADELAVAARKAGVGTALPSRSEEPEEEAVHVYVGVTCRHKTGAGGWAVILTWRGHVKVIGGREAGMTANQLYIRAAIGGLEHLKKRLPVRIHTHSGYLCDGASSWLEGWRRRNWRTREGEPVSNRELWQRLAGLLDVHRVRFVPEDRDNPACAAQEAKELAREFERGDGDADE